MEKKLDLIAEASKLSDHFCRVCLLGLLIDGGSPLVVMDARMQNSPDEPTQSVGNRPDRLFEPKSRE
jgi:hypothetical protein